MSSNSVADATSAAATVLIAPFKQSIAPGIVYDLYDKIISNTSHYDDYVPVLQDLQQTISEVLAIRKLSSTNTLYSTLNTIVTMCIIICKLKLPPSDELANLVKCMRYYETNPIVVRDNSVVPNSNINNITTDLQQGLQWLATSQSVGSQVCPGSKIEVHCNSSCVVKYVAAVHTFDNFRKGIAWLPSVKSLVPSAPYQASLSKKSEIDAALAVYEKCYNIENPMILIELF